MFDPKKILVPTDFSQFSDHALREALDIAKQYNAKIRLFHVVGVIHQCSVDYCMDESQLAGLEKETMKSAQEMMEEQVGRVGAGGEKSITFEVKQGIAYEEILKEERAKKVDLIVIASHGKTGLLGHFGSVADRVARGAKAPVLIVKGG